MMNTEDPFQAAKDFHSLIGHIHASEPYLMTLGEGGVPHGKMAQALKPFLSEKLVVIEMLATKTEPHIIAIERALKLAILSYSQKDAF